MRIHNQEIEKLFSDALIKLQELIKIPSYSNPEKISSDFIYGADVHQALTFMIDLGKEMGFKTFIDSKLRYGYLETGDGSEMVGILCHLDVVPPGDLKQWNNPPFIATIKDNILYGRGAIDNKGPTIINLYALKHLVDQGFKFKKRIRMIFGLTEETTWDSIKAYLANEELPTVAYTPDGYFPLVYAEKSILNIDIVEENPKQDYIVSGGQAYNVTCDLASYIGSKQDALINELKNLNYEYLINNDEVTVVGVAAHGSKPQTGVNAAIRLLTAINNINSTSKLTRWVANELQEDVHALKVVGHQEDETGTLTFNVGFVNMDQHHNMIGCDLRIPVHAEVNDILHKIKQSLEPYNLKVVKRDVKNKLFFDKNSQLIKTLLNVYQSVTNEKTEPIAIGGGTYARSMPNCIAFGAIFNGHTSTEHQYNEHVNCDELKIAMEIYIAAIKALDQL